MIQTSPMSWIFMFIMNFFSVILILNLDDKKFFKNKYILNFKKKFLW